MSNPILSLASELRADMLSARAAPALSAGFMSGLGLLVAQIAFATFIFSGPLAPYSSQGVGLVLFGNFAGCLIVALAGGYRGAISGLSPALVIAMAAIGATMDATGEALFVTAAAALAIAAAATGAGCFALGRFRLANLVRFIPYPVAGGFVAGIGGAVCLAAMSLMGAETGWRSLPALLDPSALWRWAPGALYGIGLYWAMKRWGNALILPASVALAVGGYHAVLAALGISGEEARAAGLLLSGTSEEGLWPALGPADLALVDWSAMAGQVVEILTLMAIALICVAMNVAGLETVANRDLDWDREFRASGLASMVAGVGGGTVATLVVPASLRSKLFGAETRLTGVVAALVIGGALFLGDGMLELVPAALVGGILVFAGLGMLDEGLVRTFRRLPRLEYAIVALIFVAIVWFGLFEGVGAGMLAALAFFAARLGLVDPVERHYTARDRRSGKARPAPDRAILRADGDRAPAYALRGYIFFGSIGPLTDRLGRSLAAAEPPSSLMLDFTAVSGLDFSAVNALSRFLRAARAAGVPVVLSAAPGSLLAGLERTLPAAEFAALALEPDEDRALERCEDIAIEAWKAGEGPAEARRDSLLRRAADEVERQLERQIAFEELVEELGARLEPRDYAAGEALAGPGAAASPDCLQLLASGRASAYGRAGARLRQFGPGDAVWPASALDDGSAAAVVADEDCRALALEPEARSRLEAREEALALGLYRYLLAGRFRAGAECVETRQEES